MVNNWKGETAVGLWKHELEKHGICFLKKFANADGSLSDKFGLEDYFKLALKIWAERGRSWRTNLTVIFLNFPGSTRHRSGQEP